MAVAEEAVVDLQVRSSARLTAAGERVLSELLGAEAGLQEHSRHPRSEEVAVVESDHLEQSPAGAGVEEAEETLPTRLTRKKGEEAQAVQEEPSM